ncbi:hypothetical protein CJU90_0218 [Yarrowia sp. C11]|nr:hypothetical protein CKK34_1631 [Yarrowia sp. E02]KAG5372571.1 hypothetical protein CJU90_0218 [Yarrowia sp. C11]
MDAKEYLTVAISGEQLSVSYAMLSRKFGIAPKQAREILSEYVDSNKSDKSLHVTYCLRGVKKHGVSTIELCNDANIAEKRAEFNEPVSQLIYSVSASPSTTAILYNMALEASTMGPNKFAIVSELAKGVDFTPTKPVIKDDSPAVAAPSKPLITTAPAKKPSAAKQKPKLDFFGGKKKTESKKEETKETKEKETTPVKEEPKVSTEEKAPVKEEKPKEEKKPKVKSVLDAVKEGKKNEPKPQEPKPKTKKQLEAEEAEKKRQKELADALFADEDEDFDLPLKKQQSVKKEEQEKEEPETIKEELEENLKEAKEETTKDAQKIAGGKLDVTTEDVEMGDNDSGEKEDVEMTDVHMTNDGEDVHTTTTKARRGKKKVIKKVQELDEDGYVTYKKVETWESCDEDEDETGMKEEIKKAVVKETKKEVKTESPEPTPGAKKSKKANKQSSLMSFFKK